MPAARGVKRTASKSSSATSSAPPKSKKKRGAIELEIPTLPKSRGCVFTCGQGDVGQLGLGEDVIETTKFKKVTALGDKIVAISAGGMHTIALDSSGKVWTYGCNDEGALGRPTSGDKDEATPKRVSLPGVAVLVSAGDSHSAALLHNGDVYAWGAFRDSHGSMGLVVRGREGKPCREPARVALPEPAASIASGSDHLVILTTSGVVYSMGCGEQGQLGRLTQRSASRDARQGFSALLVPSKVSVKGGACAVWAGYHATFVLDAARNKLYAFGLNNYSQLGITGEKRKTAVYAPTECDAVGDRAGGLRRVAPGQHHSLLLDDAGAVYAVGRCEYGRLGLGDRTTDAETLEPVTKLQDKKCISIATGTSNSFAVTDNGEVYGWGMGSEGQLGCGGAEDASEPTRAALVAQEQYTPAQVAAGGQHTVLLAIDPNAKCEPSPSVEGEEEGAEGGEQLEEGTDDVMEDAEREQEEEVTSTSSAPAHTDNTNTDKPQKVNGDETKPTEMEVDETDNTQTSTEQSEEQKMDSDADKTDSKEEKGDSSDASQDTEAGAKSRSPQPEPCKEINGTEQAESKSEVNSVTA